MRNSNILARLLFACCVAGLAMTLSYPSAAATSVSVSKTDKKAEVRYVSASTVYVEELLGGRWSGRYWSNDGRVDRAKFWDSDAFEIRIKDKPSPSEVPGTPLSGGWKWVSASEQPGANEGSRHFVVELSNSNFPVGVRVHTLLDGTPVLTRWLETSNRSDKPMALTGLVPWCGRLWSGDAEFSLGHSLRSDKEGWFGWTTLKDEANVFEPPPGAPPRDRAPLKPGTNRIENNRGLSYDDPYFFLRNEGNGEYFFGELAWPTCYGMEFTKDKGLTFKIGPTALDALRVVAPGETITTPAVHLGCVRQDFDLAVQAMHDHVRRSVLAKRGPERTYLTQYLIPEDWPMTVYRGEDYNEENMKKCIDVAAAVGLEVFILDGPMWGSAYGNWLTPNQERFPNGLTPLVDYAHKKGMLFGLYAEPEGGRDNYTSGMGGATIGPWSQCETFNEHPDWFLQPDSRLNLSIPEAASYVESEVAGIVSHYKLDLYRHDFNGPMRNEGSSTVRDGFRECDYWRHYDAFYGMFHRLHEKYLDLILQQAAGGNARLDLPTAATFHEQFTSDVARMPLMFRAISGLSVYLPPEILVSSNGMAVPKDLPDTDTTLRGAYTLGLTPMIFNALLPRSVEELAPEFQKKCLHYSTIYKSFIRPMLSTCRIWHHDPVNANGGQRSGDWLAMEFSSPDKAKGWATIIRLTDKAGNEYLFKPKGLDAGKKYRVTFDNAGATQEINGSQLMREGIMIRPSGGTCSELILFERK